MAKDTPNKPDEAKNKPTTEQTERATPVIKPPAAEIPATDKAVISADKLNEPAGDKQKTAAKPEQTDRAKPGQEPPSAVGKPKAPAKGQSRPPKEAGADKPKPEATKKTDKTADKVIPLRPADSDEKLRQKQEAPLSMLDEKAAVISPVKSKPSAAEKTQPTPDSPELAERKQKLEKELREKYGIPKSDKPVQPWVAPEEEKVVRIPHDKLHSFKGHTFNVEKNAKFMAFVASIRAHGVTQPAIVRPDGKDSYEIVSGHRRNLGGIEAGIPYTPCIVRALNDEQAIQQMVEDNVNNRDISIMELARSLKVQLDSIKRQGVRDALNEKNLALDTDEKIGKRSNEIIAERNGMSIKQVQRHIALTRLTPALQEYVDGKPAAEGKKTIQLGFIPAVELSYIKPEHQNYIAVAIEGQQSTPSLSQAQRLRELDKKGLLNPDVIDGIFMEEKKEVDKVILSSQELSEFFGKDKTPREMKDTIMKLLGEWKNQQKELTVPEKKSKQPEK